MVTISTQPMPADELAARLGPFSSLARDYVEREDAGDVVLAEQAWHDLTDVVFYYDDEHRMVLPAVADVMSMVA